MTEQSSDATPSNPYLKIIEDTLPIWRLLVGQGLLAIIVQLINIVITEFNGEVPFLLGVLQQFIYFILCITMAYLTMLHFLPISDLIGLTAIISNRMSQSRNDHEKRTAEQKALEEAQLELKAEQKQLERRKRKLQEAEKQLDVERQSLKEDKEKLIVNQVQLDAEKAELTEPETPLDENEIAVLEDVNDSASTDDEGEQNE